MATVGGIYHSALRLDRRKRNFKSARGGYLFSREALC
jgi:hypothetical protein